MILAGCKLKYAGVSPNDTGGLQIKIWAIHKNTVIEINILIVLVNSYWCNFVEFFYFK